MAFFPYFCHPFRKPYYTYYYMSVIQQIRDKAAWLVFGLIALSLVGFLLMDAFVGRSRVFGGNSTTIGSVNGDKLDYVKFDRLVSDQEEVYKAKGYPVNDITQQNIKEGVWKQFVEESVLADVYKELGLDISDKELNDMLVGQNAIPEIRQSFTDPKTGIFDAQAAASTINQLRTIYKANRKTDKSYDEAKRFFEEGIPQIIKARQKEKYLALVANSVYVPKWMVEKMNADNSQVAAISYVDVPYSTIPDSSIKITDDEINEYVSQHKAQYKQEETRSIAYVLFNAAPTAGDSANILQQLLNLKSEFGGSKDGGAFIARNGSEIGFFDSYLAKSKIQVPKKDSIINLPVGGMYGPYLDGNNYVIAKKIDEKTLPDSVRARHILIATTDTKTGQPIMEDSVAKKRIDSIENLIDHGANFDSLASKLSDDQVSKIKGGDLGYFTQGQMVKEFDNFSFNGKKGEKKIVKTQFGYHYIEILDQKTFEPAYKIAYLAKKIEASAETDQNASGMANQFAGESRNQKAFDENIQKHNLQKLLAPDIRPIDYTIPGIGVSRQLVRWIFDSSPGDVSEPQNVGDKYLVAMLTDINHEGTMRAAKARPLVEPILRNKKKADEILKKIGNAPSLEAVAASTNQKVQQADSISFNSPYIPNLGQESKVVGSAFDQQIKGKTSSPPISGNGGVFLIKIQNWIAKTNSTDPEETRRNQQQIQQSMAQRQAIEVLQKTADVKDNRGKFL
jgi:peptidyl-prolyl cis-trans isomerase D